MNPRGQCAIVGYGETAFVKYRQAQGRDNWSEQVDAARLAPYLPASRAQQPSRGRATLHRGRDNGAYAIALVNFTGAPLDALRLEIDPAALGAARTVRAEYGAVTQHVENGRIVVTLPIDKFDYLYLE